MRRQTGNAGRLAPLRLRAMVWRLAGAGLFALGLVGAVLPVLPTTIFWILALIALGKSDPALSARIRAWPGAGAVVAAFVDHGVITRRSKAVALAGMSFSAVLLWLAVDGLGLAFGWAGIVAGAAYVFSRPEAPAKMDE